MVLLCAVVLLCGASVLHIWYFCSRHDVLCPRASRQVMSGQTLEFDFTLDGDQLRIELDESQPLHGVMGPAGAFAPAATTTAAGLDAVAAGSPPRPAGGMGASVITAAGLDADAVASLIRPADGSGATALTKHPQQGGQPGAAMAGSPGTVGSPRSGASASDSPADSRAGPAPLPRPDRPTPLDGIAASLASLACPA